MTISTLRNNTGGIVTARCIAIGDGGEVFSTTLSATVARGAGAATTAVVGTVTETPNGATGGFAPVFTPLGLALSRLRARRELGPDPRIRYLQYEDLVKNPVDVMRQVFAHLELPAIEVNHQNVIKSAAEHDAVFGIYGRHHVRQTVCKE